MRMKGHKQCQTFDALAHELGQCITDIAHRCGELNGRKISVGIRDDAVYPNGTKVKYVADRIECGWWKKKKDGEVTRIAPRPFMRNAISENKDKWMREIGEKCTDIAAGRGSNYKQAMSSIGKEIAEVIKNNITNMGAVKTGRLRDSVTAEVM